MTDGPLVVVQARAGSTRLPGKVLAEVAGRPMLALMLARLAPLRPQATVVVATSREGRDDPVAELAAACDVAVVRGDEADVLGRFAQALAAHPADLVVRLTADCPLIDPTVVADVVARHRRDGAAYTSNTLVRTFPDGLDVEVLDADVLLAAHREATAAAEREHVTPFVYRRPRRFGLAQHVGPQRLGDERWTVDRAEDLEVIREAVGRLADPESASWTEVLAALGRRAAPPEGPLAAVPAEPVAHRAGRPYERRWDLVAADGAPAGRASVVVDDAVGTLTIDLPEPLAAHRPAAVAAVRRWLAADLQVTDLRDPGGTRP